jgi:hypothetical protein
MGRVGPGDEFIGSSRVLTLVVETIMSVDAMYRARRLSELLMST